MKKLIAGNWKMNGTVQDSKALIAEVLNGIYEQQEVLEKCDFVVCPSFLHISAVRHATLTTDFVACGGQDCSADDNGAHTGDISAGMLKDAKCSHVILGHSERRQGQGEADDLIAAKAAKAHESGLITIICVGETDEQREQGTQQDIVAAQLKGSIPSSATAENTVIAYEPVWAIGTGKTASVEDVKAMHGFIREKLQEQLDNSQDVRILYGGSMKPENAADLLATENVDGGLIGGASLKAASFIGIALNAPNNT